MAPPSFTERSAANDNANAVRPRPRKLVPLIGTIDVDTGRFTPAEVVEMIPLPSATLARRTHGPEEP